VPAMTCSISFAKRPKGSSFARPQTAVAERILRARAGDTSRRAA
jgi:hypothetical protein